LKKLKEEINAAFILGGKGNENKEHMLTNDILEINGNS